MRALFEALKTVLRVAVLAAISAFLTSISDSITKLPLPSGQLGFILGFVLIGADKWIHENKNISLKGIIPF